MTLRLTDTPHLVAAGLLGLDDTLTIWVTRHGARPNPAADAGFDKLHGTPDCGNVQLAANPVPGRTIAVRDVLAHLHRHPDTMCRCPASSSVRSTFADACAALSEGDLATLSWLERAAPGRRFEHAALYRATTPGTVDKVASLRALLLTRPPTDHAGLEAARDRALENLAADLAYRLDTPGYRTTRARELVRGAYFWHTASGPHRFAHLSVGLDPGVSPAELSGTIGNTPARVALAARVNEVEVWVAQPTADAQKVRTRLLAWASRVTMSRDGVHVLARLPLAFGFLTADGDTQVLCLAEGVTDDAVRTAFDVAPDAADSPRFPELAAALTTALA